MNYTCYCNRAHGTCFFIGMKFNFYTEEILELEADVELEVLGELDGV